MERRIVAQLLTCMDGTEHCCYILIHLKKCHTDLEFNIIYDLGVIDTGIILSKVNGMAHTVKSVYLFCLVHSSLL